jgi:hypothetical protein
VCEPECPVDAIKPDTEPNLDKWLELNRQYSESWPNITTKKAAPPDADAFVAEPDKFTKYFSPNPGEGASLRPALGTPQPGDSGGTPGRFAVSRFDKGAILRLDQTDELGR